MLAFIYDESWKVWVGESCSAAQVYSGSGVDLSVISCQLVDRLALYFSPSPWLETNSNIFIC